MGWTIPTATPARRAAGPVSVDGSPIASRGGTDGRDLGRRGGRLRPRRSDRRGVPGRCRSSGAGARAPRPGRRQLPGVPPPPSRPGLRVRRRAALHRRLRTRRAVPVDLRRARRRRPHRVPAARPRRLRHLGVPRPAPGGARRLGRVPRSRRRRAPRRACRGAALHGHPPPGRRGEPDPGHPRRRHADVRPLGVPSAVGAVRARRAVSSGPGGARPLVGAVRRRPVADRGGDARHDHRPLHARRGLPRGGRAGSPGPAHPGDRGVRGRDPVPEHRRGDPGAERSSPRRAPGRRIHDLRPAGHLQRGPHPHCAATGRPASLGSGHTRVGRAGDHDPGVGVRVRDRRRGARRTEHQLLPVPLLRDR